VSPTLHLLGSGRAGTAIARLLARRSFPIGSVCSRNLAHAEAAVALLGSGRPTADPAACFAPAAWTLVALPEGAIAPLAAQLASRLPDCRGAVALHVSGALPGEALAPLRARGVAVGSVHPLAAFADRARPPDSLAGTTFDLDGDPAARAAARTIVAALEGHPLELDGDGKALFHAAAATAANGLVALLDVATQLAERGGAKPDAARRALVALARSALDAIEQRGAPDALTGPIERGEAAVVAAHLAALAAAAPELLPAYRDFARATLATARRAGRLAPAAAAELARLLAP